MQFSTTGGELMVQMMYKLLHAVLIIGGVLMVQVMYRLMHEVQSNWRCIGGSSNVKITACSTVQLAVY